MKYIFILIIGLGGFSLWGQTPILNQYHEAEAYLKDDKFQEAYDILKKIEALCPSNDTIYDYIIGNYTFAAYEIGIAYRMEEKYDSSLKYAFETLALIQKGKKRFGEIYTAKEYWTYKNIIVSYFGLNQLDKAQKYKQLLYKAYQKHKLPKGIDEYFNFDFFKLNGNNIWGYEWYEALPKNRFSKSFTKVIYYVYSTNDDGSDKEQLYRFHVLMFHQSNKKTQFDYVLEKQFENETQRISTTYMQYTYKEKIDYLKLRKDIIEIITKGISSTHIRKTNLINK